MLQIRFHDDFKGRETLLFAGSGADINRLLTFFRNWQGEKVNLVECLQAQEKIYLHSVKEINLQEAKKSSDLNWNGNCFNWSISASYLETIIGLLEVLVESSRPGHQYLDYPGLPGSFQIMVAKDEYPLPSA